MSTRRGAYFGRVRAVCGDKRVSPPKRKFRPLSLGIRENTRMTVTVREELFYFFRIFFGIRLLFATDGFRAVFYF